MNKYLFDSPCVPSKTIQSVTREQASSTEPLIFQSLKSGWGCRYTQVYHRECDGGRTVTEGAMEGHPALCSRMNGWRKAQANQEVTRVCRAKSYPCFCFSLPVQLSPPSGTCPFPDYTLHHPFKIRRELKILFKVTAQCVGTAILGV